MTNKTPNQPEIQHHPDGQVPDKVSHAGYNPWKNRRTHPLALSTPRGLQVQHRQTGEKRFSIPTTVSAGVRTIIAELGTRGITATAYAVHKKP